MAEYTVRDIPLLGRAAKSRWALTDSQRADIVRDMHKIATDQEQTETNRIKAADMLRKIDVLNLNQEKMLMSRVDVNVSLEELTDVELEAKLNQLKGLLSDTRGTPDTGTAAPALRGEEAS